MNSIQKRLECIYHHIHQNTSNEQFQKTDRQAQIVDNYPVIIGAMAVDIHAMPSTTIFPGTTTPGQIRWLSGGVARNVAECMSRLGAKPFMISVVGVDIPGTFLLNSCNSAGLLLAGIRRHAEFSTPVICNVFSIDGELAAAVASVDAVEGALLPEWVCQFEAVVRAAPILMVDANMNSASLEAVCQLGVDSGVPVWFEPVSITKSKRIAPFLNMITCASPNKDELLAIANAISSSDKFTLGRMPCSGGKKEQLKSMFQMLKPAICLLLEKGLKMLLVTLGSEGVLLCFRKVPNFIKNTFNSSRLTFGRVLYELVSGKCPPRTICCLKRKDDQECLLPHMLHFPALTASVVRLTGAGDCLVGGILASLCSGLDIMQSTAVGVAVAKVAVERIENVPLQFFLSKVAGCRSFLQDDAKEVYSAVDVIY